MKKPILISGIIALSTIATNAPAQIADTRPPPVITDDRPVMVDKRAPSADATTFSGSFDASIGDEYFSKVGRGPSYEHATQETLTLGLRNVARKADYVSISGWANSGRSVRGGGAYHLIEVDGTLNYSSGSIYDTGTLFGENSAFKGNISLTTSVEYWYYLNSPTYDHDWATTFGASFTGRKGITVSAKWLKVLPQEGARTGDYYTIRISKTIPVLRIGSAGHAWQLSFTPLFSATATDNYYIKGSDFNLQPTVSLTLTNPKGNFSIRITGAYNKNYGSQRFQAVKNEQTFISTGANYKF